MSAKEENNKGSKEGSIHEKNQIVPDDVCSRGFAGDDLQQEQSAISSLPIHSEDMYQVFKLESQCT